MNAPWWPPAAPVPAQKIGELTSRELAIMTRFAEQAAPGPDAGRFAELGEKLRREAAERRDLLDRLTATAKAGRTGVR